MADSRVVESCQICGSKNLESVLFLGYHPPVNAMVPVGTRPSEQPSYPAELLRCPNCSLVQLGLVVNQRILFPPTYPYTSGTTKILRDNFADLYREATSVIKIQKQDLVVDIGSNDGTLLKNFRDGGYRVIGVEPTRACELARASDIPTLEAFFNVASAGQVLASYGKAKIVTAANVFAHIDNVHEVVECVLDLLDQDGVFITESHYLHSLLETLQYDTIYHEHLRYYSLESLCNLFNGHGLEVFRCKKIPTHGGSIRVYAAREGVFGVDESVEMTLEEEDEGMFLEEFRSFVGQSKLLLLELLSNVKQTGSTIFGVGAPSRASTLVNYVGLDEQVIDKVVEIRGSHKIGKYMPGTLIPVVDEAELYEKQPEYALLFSWHIADELIPKLKANGYRGRFIIPLPTPDVVE